MDPASSAAAMMLLFGVLGPTPATAQPPTTGLVPTSETTTAQSAYAQLPPSQQKIALALYSAQPTSGVVRPLTLNQIAAMKRRGQTWNQVFATMKAQGLVQEQTLAQVVASAKRSTTQTSASTVVNATRKALPKSRPEHALSADDGAAASVDSTDADTGH